MFVKPAAGSVGFDGGWGALAEAKSRIGTASPVAQLALAVRRVRVAVARPSS